MSWGDDWKAEPSPPQPTEAETKLVEKVKEDYKYGEDWEAEARLLFDYDYKFANGDTHNKYQWDNDLVLTRELDDKPCLTINKTNQHNLMVINDAKQNKPGIRIRPVGDESTYEGAQIYQELIYHIEYISSAENVYDSATSFQVQAGIGYWRVDTDYISPKSFDQEIYIRHIKDPRAVYLDPDINEMDGSDARWGLIFEDMPTDLFKKKHPKFAAIGGNGTLGNTSDGWITKNHIRVCLYYYKEEGEDKLVTWVGEQGQIIKKLSELSDLEMQIYSALKANKEAQLLYQFRQRKIVTENVKWVKIAGDRIIEGPTEWLGNTIPIVRLVGTEIVIDGILDRKGHTRALINAQQIYNYMSSSNVEYISTQSKTPWIAPSAAIEGFEEYYKSSNRVNHSYIPYNAIDEDGNPIPAPTRNAAPQSSQGYVQQMQVAQNELMMVSGQYQAQMGENENAKSGVAINARQRQGDRATYHFIDNLAIAIRRTGKILIDLIPKVYDTPRIKKILAQDGNRINVKIDVEAKQGLEDVSNKENPLIDNGQKVKEVIFNPDFGMYDIQADSGPSYATKRMETSQILMELTKIDPEISKLCMDILFKNLDFSGADTLSQRFFKALPPSISGNELPPDVQDYMHKASDMIQGLQGKVNELSQQLKDKTTELTQKGQRLDLDFRDKASTHAREDYKAETERLRDIFNTAADGEGMDPTLKIIFKQLADGILKNGELEFSNKEDKEEEPPIEGAVKAADGSWYLQNENGWNKVELQ